MNPASVIDVSLTSSRVEHRPNAAASIDNVARAVRAALRTGGAVVWIGTNTGLRWLETRLTELGVDVVGARDDTRMVCLDAVRTLADICVDGLPDVVLFAERVGAQIDAAANRCARVTIVAETQAGGLPAAAAALQALVESFVRSRAIFSYRACRTDACRCEPTTQPGRNRWSIDAAGLSLAIPIPFKTKECP